MPNLIEVEEKVAELLEALDIDLTEPNFIETPRRYAEFLIDLVKSREMPDLKAFPSDMNQMVLLKNYKCYSLCPHHLLPVEYEVKLAYIPHGKVLGLSKLARLIDWHMQFIPLQEDLTENLVQQLDYHIKPMGSGCRIVGVHMCVSMRGVEAPEARFVTTRLKGALAMNPSAKQEFLSA